MVKDDDWGLQQKTPKLLYNIVHCFGTFSNMGQDLSSVWLWGGCQDVVLCADT